MVRPRVPAERAPTGLSRESQQRLGWQTSAPRAVRKKHQRVGHDAVLLRRFWTPLFAACVARANNLAWAQRAPAGLVFRERVANMGTEEVVIAPRSPWQNPYTERLSGSIRREDFEHVIILNGRHLMRILSVYFDCYLHSRTHLSLDRNAPVEREVESPFRGRVVAIPQVGGLHHRYCRAA